MFLSDVVLFFQRRFNKREATQQVTFELPDGCTTFPSKAHAEDVGYDLYAAEDIVLPPFTVSSVKTGVRINVHGENIFPKIESRSGLALKSIFAVGGIIEPKYKGEIRVLLYNGSAQESKISLNHRIAQVVFYRYTNPVRVETLFMSDRQAAGFGSSGA